MSDFLFVKEPVILATPAHQVHLKDPKNGTNWKFIQVEQNNRVWDVPEVKDIENDKLNVLKIIVEHRVDEHVVEDNTLRWTEVDPTVVERPNVRHVTDNFIDNNDDEQSSSYQSGSSDDE